MQCNNNNNNNNNTLLHWLFKSFKALVFGCLKFKQNPVTSSIYTLIKVLIEATSYPVILTRLPYWCYQFYCFNVNILTFAFDCLLLLVHVIQLRD